MIDTVLSILTSGGFGAITGLIGGFLTRVQENKRHALDQKHALAMRKLDLGELQLEHRHQLAVQDKNIELAETEGNLRVDLEEARAFTESQKSGGRYMDAAKSIMRPILTLYVVALTSVMFAKIHGLLADADALPLGTLANLYADIAQQIVFLTVLGFSWWFSARPTSLRR